jgi:tetratricopeptide (TPR) repeat protein/predicted Ser/Thr protein kinase
LVPITVLENDIGQAFLEAGYELISLLGSGGMGLVYEARQIALNRPVALKILRNLGNASESELTRFHNEAQVVARMDHPHVVPIYEVGQSRGHDFFAMKLIPGRSLDRALGDYLANPRRAASLLATVAEAVHHAHARGILHRDLKPANILIDPEGQPHVTDFGIAYRLDGDGQQTRPGVLVGTPSYMSPEQAGGDHYQLTTASDVYGLGAVFYALLTGRAPLTGTTLFETIDLVRSAVPESPSKTNRLVPRDLELICLKCLEKEPTNRYPDARSLAEDLRRWLAGEPIAARPVGAVTRVWLWCRRHPVPSGLSAALVASIVIGMGLVTWKWQQAERSDRTSRKTARFLAERVLREASTDLNPRSSNPSLREVLDRSAARVVGDFHDEPEVEATIRETLGSAYASLGEHQRAESQLVEALKLDRTLLGPSHPTTIHVASMLAALLDARGKTGEAETLLQDNRKLARNALGRDAAETLEADDHLGSLLRRLGRRDEAEPILRETLAARSRTLPTDDPAILRSVRELCLLAVDRGNMAEAETLAIEFEHGIRCAFGPKHPDNVAALANRGLILRLRGQISEAIPFYRRAAEEALRILGPDHPSPERRTTSSPRSNIRPPTWRGRVAEAIDELPQLDRLYLDRTAGRDRDHQRLDRSLTPRCPGGARGREADSMHE